MKVTFGLKAHSGWAALVVLGRDDGDLTVVDRRRIDLVEEDWAKQPYHAAEELKLAEARELVKRGVAAANSMALREMRALVKRERKRENEITACAVLVSEPMPKWTTDEILAVHFRMHKAEGVLFREALVRSAKLCGLDLVGIPEKLLMKHAEKALGTPEVDLVAELKALGKSIGPPWGKDQRDAALAALVGLEGQ